MGPIHEQSFQESFRKAQSEQYLSLLNDLREDLNQGEEFPFASHEFQELFSECLFRQELSSFTPVNFHWSSLVDQLIYLGQLHAEIEENKSVSKLIDPDLEEELFNFWNESEYVGVFLSMLESNSNIDVVSSELFPVLENQVISFFCLHICDEIEFHEKPIAYHPVPEMGEKGSQICIGPKFLTVKVKDAGNDFFQVVGAKYVSNLLVIEENKKRVELQAKEYEHIKNKNKEILLLPTYPLDRKKIEGNVTRALGIIESYSPKCFQVFNQFTVAVVPVNEPGVVSYSMQSLPGFSSINTVERDFIDLIDDLIHENGHHYLNTILNGTDLINEDDEKIYYSPWRRSLRPVRGIYHGVFTFFWAVQLFGDLCEHRRELSNKLDAGQILKVTRRYIEEHLMVSFCGPLLQDMKKNGKLTKEGAELIEQVMLLVSNHQGGVDRASEFLKENSSDDYKKINELKSHLSQMHKKYIKSL